MSFIIDNTAEFLHIPKTAGVWIEHICKPWIEIAGTNHDKGRRHGTGRLTLMPTFAVARSPYSWFKSCRGYTQKLWIIVEKNYPGWFQNCPYKQIGQLESLRVKDVPLDTVIKEYLKKMPGEYTRATMEWYVNADRLVSFDSLLQDLTATLRAFKVPHAHRIEWKAKETAPMNTSKSTQVCVKDTGLIGALNEAEHEWLDYVKGGRK